MNLILKMHDFFPSQKIITILIILINGLNKKSPFNYKIKGALDKVKSLFYFQHFISPGFQVKRFFLQDFSFVAGKNIGVGSVYNVAFHCNRNRCS